MRLSGRRAGFTLMELILVISLAMVIGIPVGKLLAEHLTGAIRARDYTVGMNLARWEMERLDSLDSATGLDNANGFCHLNLNLTSLTPSPINNYWPGYPYALTRIVQCQVGDCTSNNCASWNSNGNNGIKRIELWVTKMGSGEPVATLVTYRTKYVRYGL